jgi:hypothetical protein
MATSIKYTKEFEDLKKKAIDDEMNPEKNRTCNLCSHQGVCSAFAMFRVNIEPNLMDQNALKAENLAKICNMYADKTLNMFTR